MNMENESTQDSNLLMLVEKYVNNTCSKEELEQFLALAKDGSDELVEALKFQWSRAKDNALTDEGRWDTLFHSMMNKAKEIESIVQEQPIEQIETKVHQIGGGRRRWM